MGFSFYGWCFQQQQFIPKGVCKRRFPQFGMRKLWLRFLSLFGKVTHLHLRRGWVTILIVSPFHDLFSSVCRFKGKYFELMETDTGYKINNWFLELLGIPGIEGWTNLFLSPPYTSRQNSFVEYFLGKRNHERRTKNECSWWHFFFMMTLFFLSFILFHFLVLFFP